MQNDRGPRTIVDKEFSSRKEDWDDWSKEFLDAADGRGDDDHSWKDTFLGLDRQLGLSPAQTGRRNRRRPFIRHRTSLMNTGKA